MPEHDPKRVVELIKPTKEQRKAVSKAVSAIMAARGMSYEKIYVAAHGSINGLGLNDWHNFQKGDISQEKATEVFRWIVENHLPLATEVAPEVFDPSLLTKWRDLISKQAIYDRLTIRLIGGIGLTVRSIDHPIADTPIQLGQKFVFELNGHMDGQVLALEMSDGNTYPFSLHPNRETLLLDIKAGRQTLPLGQDGEPETLMEDKDHGLRCYIFLIAPPEIMQTVTNGLAQAHPVKLEQLDRIALALTDDDDNAPPFELHRLNVIFK